MTQDARHRQLFGLLWSRRARLAGLRELVDKALRRRRRRARRRRGRAGDAAARRAPHRRAAGASAPPPRRRSASGRAAAAAGGRGTPPPPPPPPPAVMPKPVDADRVGDGAVARSARRPQGRTLGRGTGGVEHAHALDDAADRARCSARRIPISRSRGNLAIQGNYNGFDIYDITNPSKPVLVQTYLCPASQNDVSVYRNLLFMSSEATNSRADCGFEGVARAGQQAARARHPRLRHLRHQASRSW